MAGSQYSEEAKWYNPQKVQECELEVTISDGYNTPAYQMLANDFLMELFRSNALDVKTLLENSSYPFATKILESLKRNEEQPANNLPAEGVPPELMELMAKMPQNAGGDALTPSMPHPVDNLQQPGGELPQQ